MSRMYSMICPVKPLFARCFSENRNEIDKDSVVITTQHRNNKKEAGNDVKYRYGWSHLLLGYTKLLPAAASEETYAEEDHK